ncbi:Dam family site-specific DNA-(adenine-N6)-methyltransferase [Shouchella sp. 1P09AA]|uniref:DNA adenine methylase n=1 Tax=unclassified Shouchella TaxID=2893065 RepID=UPI0039A38534
MEKKLRTPIKWTGGKRQLLPILHQLVPTSYGTYIEPFAGGAALFFSLAPEKALIGDINDQLVDTYHVIRDHSDLLLQELSFHQNQEAYYYAVRDLDRSSSFQKLSIVERASRFLFLNRVGYGGMYRVNRKGQVNMPYGHYKKANITNEQVVRQASNYLQRAEVTFVHQDFEDTLATAKKGDFVYLDPPYFSERSTAFNAYAKTFTLYDHIRLKRVFTKLDKKGCHVILSLGESSVIRALYSEYKICTVEVTRLVNSDTSARKGNVELVIMNEFDQKSNIAEGKIIC